MHQIDKKTTEQRNVMGMRVMFQCAATLEGRLHLAEQRLVHERQHCYDDRAHAEQRIFDHLAHTRVRLFYGLRPTYTRAYKDINLGANVSS